MCRDHQRQSVAACPCRAQRVPTSRPCFFPALQALAPDAKAQKQAVVDVSCKLQQGSVEQCICAGKSCPQRLHHDVGTRCQVCQRFVGPRRCGSKPFCRLEARVAGASVSRQCLRHTVCKLSEIRLQLSDIHVQRTAKTERAVQRD